MKIRIVFSMCLMVIVSLIASTLITLATEGHLKVNFAVAAMMTAMSNFWFDHRNARVLAVMVETNPFEVPISHVEAVVRQGYKNVALAIIGGQLMGIAFAYGSVLGKFVFKAFCP